MIIARVWPYARENIIFLMIRALRYAAHELTFCRASARDFAAQVSSAARLFAAVARLYCRRR